MSFNATDKDGGTLTYSIIGGNVGFGFDIDSTTGENYAFLSLKIPFSHQF